MNINRFFYQYVMNQTSSPFYLQQAPVGVDLTIQSIATEESLRAQLMRLGLIPGAAIRVLEHDVGTLVLVGAARYALGAAIACQIEVATRAL